VHLLSSGAGVIPHGHLSIGVQKLHGMLLPVFEFLSSCISVHHPGWNYIQGRIRIDSCLKQVPETLPHKRVPREGRQAYFGQSTHRWSRNGWMGDGLGNWYYH